MRAAQVLGPNAGRKTITDAVRDAHRLILVVEADHRRDRSEYLLARDAAVGGNISIDGGRDEVALPLEPLSACDARQPFVPCDGEIREYLLQLRPRGERPELGRRIERITGDHAVAAFREHL